MFLTLLVAEVIISFATSWYILRILSQSIAIILNRITSDETSRAWLKFVKFAIYVAGVSSGVRVTEKDIEELMRIMEVGFAGLGSRLYMYVISRLAFEMCESVIGALRGIFWFLAYFFIAVAIAFAIIRVVELIKSKPAETQDRA